MESLKILGLLLLISFIQPSHSLTCTSQTFTNNNLYTHCADLSTLSSYLHWNYNSATSSLSIAFIAPPASDSGWVSWGINPNGTGMIGTQALVAFSLDGAMTVNTYNLAGYSQIIPQNLSFEVSDKSAEKSGGFMRIFATVKLPEKTSTINQVWQVGAAVTNGFPAKHEFQTANLMAKSTLDLTSGASTGGSDASDRIKKKNIHGVLNAVSWGILFPVGIIIARYMRTFESADPAWFYLHVTCQVSAYAIGVAGWATGIKLGSESKSIQYTTHRNIGITLFALATLQVFALFLRPKKDHKFRTAWNFYHHGVGYAILVLGILNVFKGLSILQPRDKWKTAYIIVISVLGGIAVLLELITWIVVLGRKSSKSTKQYNGESRK
ncbi:Cytochrome b561/ferric reductase transmembrane [Dillenia turbinata]|uniref:Cytochrome b561 and DOMON domain-containing protein n=1 Tax=Dillenia turbinata TaxID=194707 RepID=A0AAN8W2S6_9MAGN